MRVSDIFQNLVKYRVSTCRLVCHYDVILKFNWFGFIASYDDYTLEFVCDRMEHPVCTGSDADITKMIEMDAPFYQRGNIDRAPVSVPGGDDHE